MASRAKATVTTDHDEIRQWAEERGARPACVRGTGGGDDPGMIRLDFPGFSGKGSLESIEWNEFFEWFDKNELAFIYQDRTRGGQPKINAGSGRLFLSRESPRNGRWSGSLPPAARSPSLRTSRRSCRICRNLGIGCQSYTSGSCPSARRSCRFCRNLGIAGPTPAQNRVQPAALRRLLQSEAISWGPPFLRDGFAALQHIAHFEVPALP